MLQVLRPAGNGCLYSMTNAIRGTWWSPDLNAGPFRAYAFNPALMLFPIQEGFAIDGEITVEPSTVLDGENHCLHTQYEGTIIPKGQIVPEGTLSWWTSATDIIGDRYTFQKPFPCYDSASGQSICTHYIPFGRDTFFSRTFPTKAVFSRWNTRYYTTTYTIASVYEKGHQLVCCGKTSIGSSATRYAPMTQFCAHVVEFDPQRGYRYRNLAPDSYSEIGTYDTPQTLLARVKGLFANYLYCEGAFSWTGRGYPAQGQSPSRSPLQDDAFLFKRLPELTRALLPNRFPDWGELSYKCMSQMKTWNGNGIALSRDLITLREQVSAAIKLIKGWRNPKNWASAFLSAKYGIPLTISDTRKLIASLKLAYDRQGPTKVSSSTSWSSGKLTYECHYGIWCKPYDKYLDSLDYKLSVFDANSTFGNAWDLIPFSFVIDWFVDVGNYLDHLDRAMEFSSYEMLGSIYSLKVSRLCEPRDLCVADYEGEILISRYSRLTSRTVFSPSVNTSALQPIPFDHWIEGGALMVQKL